MKERIAYSTLSEIVGGMVLNNNVHSIIEDFDVFAGSELYNEDEYEEEYNEVYQEYIISEQGAEFLKAHTDELVYFSESTGIFLWAITHYGTPWNGVFTEIDW